MYDVEGVFIMGKKKPANYEKLPAIGIVAIITAFAAVTVCAALVLNKWQLELELNGEETVHVEYGDTYEDEGAECVFLGTVLTFMKEDVEVQKEGSFDLEKTGEYVLTYKADYKNLHAEKTRTVIVEDTVPPQLILKSDPDSYTPFNHPYEEEGFTATDNYDGDLSDKVVSEEKDGKVYYSVSDSSGNTVKMERTILYDDRKAPDITLTGGDTLTFYVGDTLYHEWEAVDDVDGDLGEQVEITGEVDTSTPGEYQLTYTVTDSHGNKASAVRTVIVKTKPANNPGAGESAKTIYLTFDDGPGPYTDELLGILDQYNVKATFFTTSAYPGYAYCMAKEAAAGHTVAVHSATHNYSQIYAYDEAYWADFNAQNAVIAAQTGYYSTIFRFPGGSSNTVSRSYNSGIMSRLVSQAAQYGYAYFDWNVSSGDAGETTSTSVVYQNVIAGIQACTAAGVPAVVLQHDVKSYSVAAVPDIIRWGLDNGYTFSALTPYSYAPHHGLNN